MTRPKTPEQAQRMRDRRSERKMEMLSFGQEHAQSTKGRSLAKILQDELDEAMRIWLKLRKHEGDIEKIAKLRGQVRGMSLSLAIILRPYDDRVSTAKLIEKASMERIRNG